MMRFATLLLLSFLSLRVALAATYEAKTGVGGKNARSSTLGSIPVQPALGATTGQTPVPSLSVYPNPARGQTTVQVSGPGGADYKLRLSNVLGSEVRRLLVRPDNQANEGFALDVSDLPPGLYFCSLLVNDKTLVTKRLTVL